MFLRRIYGNPPEYGLPDKWRIEFMDNLAKRGSGHTPDKKMPDYWNGGIKWVSLADSDKLDQIYIFDTDKEISELGIANSSAVKHPPGTVIVSRDAGVGKSAILGCEMAISQHFIGWQCGSDLDNLFLYYMLQLMKPEFERMAVGSTIKTIGLGYFKKLQIAVPPLPEQRKIAQILSTWDEAIALVEALIAVLTERKKGLMQRLLTGEVRFPGFDKEWEEARLGEMVVIQSGKSPSQYTLTTSSGRYPFIKVDDLNIDNKYQSSSRTYTNDEDTAVPANSVVFPKRGAAISGNKVRLVSVPLYMDSNLMALTPSGNRIDVEYLFYTLINERLYRIADTSTIPQINNKHIEPYKIKLPIILEQRKIGNILQQCDYEIDIWQRYAQQFREQKKGLMQRLLTGEVRVQTDETK